MKIEIPKNLWIDEATADFFREGYFRGFYGLTLHFAGGSPESTDIMSEILKPLISAPLPKRKIVRFTGLYDPKDQFLPLAIEAFRSWSFEVQGVLSEDHLSLPWHKDLTWLIYQTSKPFVPITPSELWYFPPETDELPPEPMLAHPEKTILYFAKGHSVAITTKFFLTAKYTWLLL